MKSNRWPAAMKWRGEVSQRVIPSPLFVAIGGGVVSGIVLLAQLDPMLSGEPKRLIPRVL